ncbi:MAG: radical SAM protein [Elusimicrobia bacterium]|nr:radical SAM protein [Elusimicrobiota bacterium]
MKGARRARVVLVHCPPHGETEFLNIGLAYLQAVLEREGFETAFHDISFAEHRAETDFYDDYVLGLSRRIGGGVGDGVDPGLLLQVVRPELFGRLCPVAAAIVRKVEEYLPSVRESGEVFLFSVNMMTQYFAAALAYRLRASGKRTAAGGPNLDFRPLRHLLLRSGSFDAVVQGDGEGVVAALVERLALGQEPALPGVSRLDARGEVAQTPPGPLPALDSLPRPSWRGMNTNDFVPILASRGCPRPCGFCSEPGKGRFRQRAVEGVAAEMEAAAARRGHGNFHFHDDTINASPAWVDRFTARLRERGGRFAWESFCGPDGLTPERLEAMARSGCVLLKLGVQSFSDRVLRLMRRRPAAAAVRQAIINGDRLGISMCYDLLAGFPGETEADHRRTMDWAEDIFARTKLVQFSPNPFYLSLGSETHLRARDYGITLKDFDCGALPAPLRGLARACGEFPVGFRYGIPRPTVRRRIAEMGASLKRHDKDYLYLGQTALPPRRAHA